MYNFVALWIRLIALILLSAVLTVIVLFLGRKSFKKREKIVSVCAAVLLVALGGGSTLKSLIAPEVKTIVGIYESELSTKGLSPFQFEYCFTVKNEKIYLDLDAISKNTILDGELSKGEKYTISYETESNLIVAISRSD